MRVALVNPPECSGLKMNREGRCTQDSGIWGTQWPPVTLAYMAAILARDGHEVSLHDGAARPATVDEFVREVAARRPDLCFAATSTPSFGNDMTWIGMQAGVLPSARFAVFGVHATCREEEILEKNPAVQFVIRNEPEETAAELARVLSQIDGDLSTVAGLSYRHGSEVRRNPDRPFIGDLDALPFPAWNHVETDRYRLPFSRRPFLSVVPLRGCPYRCTFCTAGVYYGRRLRLRSAESVVAEIQEDRRLYGIGDVFMWAETFTLDREFVLGLSRAIREGAPGIRWTCTSRTDTVDEEMLAAMRDAGCWMMSFGVESASPEVLGRIKKNLRGGDPGDALRAARRIGIRTVGHFILGLPGETGESLAATARSARGMDLDLAQFYVAAPFVGSELHEEAVREGWLPAEARIEIGQSRASLRLPGLPPEKVDRARREAIVRFYARPRQVWRLLRLAGWGIVTQLAVEAFRAVRRWGRNVRLGTLGRP